MDADYGSLDADYGFLEDMCMLQVDNRRRKNLRPKDKNLRQKDKNLRPKDKNVRTRAARALLLCRTRSKRVHKDVQTWKRVDDAEDLCPMLDEYDLEYHLDKLCRVRTRRSYGFYDSDDDSNYGFQSCSTFYDDYWDYKISCYFNDEPSFCNSWSCLYDSDFDSFDCDDNPLPSFQPNVILDYNPNSAATTPRSSVYQW